VSVLALEPDGVVERIAAVRSALGEAVEPFSLHSPHITVWVHGFEEDVVDGPVVRPAPRGAADTVLELAVGGANSFASCPFLEVRGPGIRAVRASFLGAEERWTPYRPHLTVGRYVDDRPTAPIVRTLRPLRGLPWLPVRARLVHGVVDAWSESGDVLPT